MSRTIAILTTIVLLIAGGSAWAEQAVSMPFEKSGTIARIDGPSRLVILEDGRTVHMTGNAFVFLDGRPMTFESLHPRMTVVIDPRSATTMTRIASRTASAPGGAALPTTVAGVRPGWCGGASDVRGTNFTPCPPADRPPEGPMGFPYAERHVR